MSEPTPIRRRALSSGNGVSSRDDYLEPDPGPSLRGYLALLRRRVGLILVFAAVGLGMALVAESRQEPLFASATVIQLTEEAASPSGGLAGLAASLGGGGGNLTSQIQIIRSRLLLGQVVDSLGLQLQREVSGVVRNAMRPSGVVDNVRLGPNVSTPTLDFTFGAGSYEVRSESDRRTAAYGERVEIAGIGFDVPERPRQERLTLWVVHREDAIDALLAELRVYRRDGTNLVEIVVTGHDAAIPQRIADATAVLYRDYNGTRSRAQAERQRQYLAEQLSTVEALWEATSRELTEFRRREGLYSARSQAIAEQGGRTELDLRRAELEADRSVFLGLLAEVRTADRRGTTEILRSILSAPTIAGNPVVAGPFEQLEKSIMSRDSLLTGPFGRSVQDPDVQRLDSMIALQEGRALAAIRNHLEMLDARLAALSAIQDRTQTTLRHLAATEPEEVRLALQLEAIGESAKDLRQQYYVAGMSEAAALNQVAILDPALEGRRTGPSTNRALLLGLLFGLMVGGAGAIFLESAKTSIRRRDDLEQHFGVPGLGVIPRVRGGSGRIPPQLLRPWRGNGRNGAAAHALVTTQQVHSVAAEAFRTVRTNLLFSQGADRFRSLVVTSPAPGEGKTTTAANVAVTFAQQGFRVLLVDCDLGRPAIHQLFGLQRTPGVTEIISGVSDARAAIRSTPVANLSVLPAGSTPVVSATDLLSGDAVRTLIAELEPEFDLVILDTPPLVVMTNAAVIGAHADGVVLVVRAGQTEWEVVRHALQQLSVVGANVVGAVINDPEELVQRPEQYWTYEVQKTSP